MKAKLTALAAAFIAMAVGISVAAQTTAVKETTFPATDGVTVKLRMEGPYTADVPLQVVCYFRYFHISNSRIRLMDAGFR